MGYDLAWIKEQDISAQRELKRLRGLKEHGNHLCADCGRQDSTWASVTHGVFICITCSDVHRSVGTHVTKVKGCTGTYLWGPDELEKMQTAGNCFADQKYGSNKVSPDASKEEKQQFVTDKYAKLRFAPAILSPANTPVPFMQLSTKAADRCQADLLACDAKLVQDMGESQHRARLAVNTTPSATLLTSAPGRLSAKRADIPDGLFDDLFKDWTTPSPVKRAQLVEKLEVPAELFQVSYKNDDGIFVKNAMPAQQRREPAEAQVSSWGALCDVDDIFAELNKL